MTSLDGSPAEPRPAEDPDAPVSPGPGPRWSGDGALAPKPAEPTWGDVQTRASTSALGEFLAAQRPSLPEGVELATAWRRLGAWLIDRGIKTMILYLIFMVSGRVIPDTTQVAPELVFASALLSIGYDFLFGMRGVTPGAYFLNIRIATMAGAEPGARRALIRSFVSWLNEIVLFIGSIGVLRGALRQGLYDRFAGTVVLVVTPVEERRP